MNVRAIGVAVAVVFAMACRTSESQASGASGTAQAPADTYGTSSTAEAPSARAQGGAAAQDPLAVPGPAIKGHASDQIVAGEIGRVSASSITISSAAGDSNVLEIAPETSITVEGMGASAAELQEGQRVVASFDNVEGREVAVEIEVTGERASSAEPKDQGSPSRSTSAGESPAKGHTSDQIVSGKIEELSGSSLTISSPVGDRKVLEIAPETSITIDGMDASASDLEEGQPVRASYNQAEGEDVAVAIEAGKELSSQPKELQDTSEPAPPTGTGSSGR